MNIMESMQIMSAIPAKPQTEKVRPEITRLPRLTTARIYFRNFLRWFFRLLVKVCLRPEVRGLENVPEESSAVAVSNHLGDADVILGFAYSRRHTDPLIKSELYDVPLLGLVLEAYGVIWIHRGQPDRRAIRAALKGLREGRIISIAPEGRESLTGALEEGTGGAAYLALKANAPILPVTLTGTENKRILDNLKRLRRTKVTLTVGPIFYLDEYSNRRTAIDQGTLRIMKTLAAQLPPEYQGVYQGSEDGIAGQSPTDMKEESDQ